MAAKSDAAADTDTEILLAALLIDWISDLVFERKKTSQGVPPVCAKLGNVFFSSYS